MLKLSAASPHTLFAHNSNSYDAIRRDTQQTNATNLLTSKQHQSDIAIIGRDSCHAERLLHTKQTCSEAMTTPFKLIELCMETTEWHATGNKNEKLRRQRNILKLKMKERKPTPAGLPCTLISRTRGHRWYLSPMLCVAPPPAAKERS